MKLIFRVLKGNPWIIYDVWFVVYAWDKSINLQS